MKTCVFFGNRDCTQNIIDAVRETIDDLIYNKNVKVFYIGTQGNFDRMVQRVLAEKAEEAHGSLQCYVVLAYVPTQGRNEIQNSRLPTILPEGIENVLPRYAITWRNKWLIRSADFVVSYTQNNPNGNAARWSEKAEKEGKTVIKIK